MKATSRWLRTDKFKKFFADSGLSKVEKTRITAYTQIWQLEETKNDYWSNEGQDYIENNPHKNICGISENKSSTGRPKAPIILFRPRKKDTFQIAANYMNYNWHSSDKNSWILATKVRMNTNATQYRQHEETIDYWSNEGQDYIE